MNFQPKNDANAGSQQEKTYKDNDAKIQKYTDELMEKLRKALWNPL